MPASMISADTGGSAYVAGSSMAMVAAGPTPGSTPMAVPSTQPMKQYSRLIGVKATPKPSARLEIRSMFFFLPSGGQEGGPHRELQLQQEDEGDVAHDGQEGGEEEDLLGLELLAGQGRHEGQCIDADDQPHGGKPELGQATDADTEDDVGGDDEEQ